MAWSRANIAALLEKFVPCADEVFRLHKLQGTECDVFRSFCDDGHYAPREGAGSTRQGIYVVTPRGDLLLSWNTRDPQAVEAKLREGLALWKKLKKKERLPDSDLFGDVVRAEDAYPTDGLALRVFTRDLPRDDAPDDWRARAWNIDHLWFSAEEARALAAGALPEEAANRLVRLHCRDNARGQSEPYPREAVLEASLLAKVVKRKGDTVVLELSGVARTHQTGHWHTDDHASPTEEVRAFEGTLHGRATFDGARFTEFRLAMAGMRTGATRYNERQDDKGPAPLGVAFELAPPGERVAPSAFWGYGWSIPPRPSSPSSSESK